MHVNLSPVNTLRYQLDEQYYLAIGGYLIIVLALILDSLWFFSEHQC